MTLISTLNNLGPKLLIPVLVLAYAGAVNVAFVQHIENDTGKLPNSVSAVFNGAAAAQIDSYFRSTLPHRDTSIDVIGALRFLVFGEGRTGVVVGRDGWLFSSEEFRAVGDQSAHVANAVEGVVAVRDTLAAAGISLVVVPLPAKADLYREHAAAPAISSELEILYGSFLRDLDVAGVSTVDARAALVAKKAEGQLFLTTDTHWTPYGALSVAEAVAESQAALIGTAGFRLVPAAPVERQGDLTKFVVEGDLARALGLGPESVVPWETEAKSGEATAAADIFGNAAIPIALVGTSYSANSQWGFGSALMSTLKSDVLNLALEGLGPVEPMRRFLSSDTLRNSPPQTVIWEFPVRYIGETKLWDVPKQTTEQPT